MNFNYEAFDIDQGQRIKLEAGLIQHQRFSALRFKILDHDDESITIRVEQRKSFQGNMFDAAKLSDIAKEFFAPFAGERKIHTRPLVHRPSPVDVVTPRWIQRQMNLHSIRGRDLVEAMGVGKSEISNYVNGKKPMGQTTRAAFFYYFESLGDD